MLATKGYFEKLQYTNIARNMPSEFKLISWKRFDTLSRLHYERLKPVK